MRLGSFPGASGGLPAGLIQCRYTVLFQQVGQLFQRAVVGCQGPAADVEAKPTGLTLTDRRANGRERNAHTVTALEGTQRTLEGLKLLERGISLEGHALEGHASTVGLQRDRYM